MLPPLFLRLYGEALLAAPKLLRRAAGILVDRWEVKLEESKLEKGVDTEGYFAGK